MRAAAPLDAAGRPGTSTPPPPTVSPPATSRILVVDDEPDIREVLRLHLEAAGYRTDGVGDGAAALERLRSDPPDLMLLDVMMPRVDGWMVLRTMQDERALADIPVVLITALGSERDLLKGTLSGALQHVTKPFHVEPLLDTVREALAPGDDARRSARRARLTWSLQRIAELDAGRPREAVHVRVSRLERPPAPTASQARDPATLTGHQRDVACLLARGHGARGIATTLGVSRAAVYATRARIAAQLEIAPRDVAEVCRRLGLGHDAARSSL